MNSNSMRTIYDSVTTMGDVGVLHDDVIVPGSPELNVYRLRLIFRSGHQVSVIRGHGAYNDDKTAEVAVYGTDGKMAAEPVGWQTQADIMRIVEYYRGL